MSVESPEQLQALRRVGRVVAQTIVSVRRAVRPGVTTAELDRVARGVLAGHGARSGPVLTYGYPGAICLSLDAEIVHGVPGGQTLRAGQLLTIDVAAELDGYHADAATTVAVGPVDGIARSLRDTARAALRAGIAAARPGATLREVGAAVERVTRAQGFFVARELTGHGIGRAMHEPPTVYNWPAADPEAALVLEDGLVMTIEPIIAVAPPRLVTAADGWTIRDANEALSAHEEHTVVVRPGGALVLTSAPARRGRRLAVGSG